MTILLYDYRELEERASRYLNVWKAWHLILYALAAIFGILNYVFLRNTMQLVDNNCVLYPRELAFRFIDLPDVPETYSSVNSTSIINDLNYTKNEEIRNAQNLPVQVENVTKIQSVEEKNVTNMNNTVRNDTESVTIENDVNILTVNETHRLVLDTSRTLFGWDNDCQYAEYMPIMSMIFAAAWATFFTMCPGGGYSRSGLQQPWRILAPALLFALIMVGLTGHSFTSTNRGLYAFCSAFYNITNATTCSSVNPYLPLARNTSWAFGARAAAARAASAGVWASWACAAALFLARCLTAPDFQIRRTGAYLNDPQQKITPYLKKSKRRRVSKASPNKRDNASIRSEPTATTELVTASVEQGQDTVPPSPQVTPMKPMNGREDIEMTITPHQLH
ncbi:uncharacterized protein LOC113396096 [Vanessa tameamea]|uniref:Uncharacterized protein LOC113396096 n=1 Tax=Vanessa tameamea TaxID=334116 RepID=A0A8B8HZK9_VANTA|nr:uncharacterized protein LOC113396096 [Vanessa tameamea]